MNLRSGPSVLARVIAFVLPTVLGALPALAQGSGAGDNAKFGWRRQTTGMLNLSQSYYDNWVKGGTDALSWELNLQGAADREEETYLWENKAKVIYGRTKLGTAGSRKASDEWNLESIYTRKLGTWVNPFASTLARSQFTAGYAYDSVGTRDLTSEFFDPAYFFQTVGIGISPVKDLTERLGFTLKETISADHGYADDAESADYEDANLEYGLSSVTEYQFALMQNILATTRLEVFANFEGWKDVDGRWENKITAKVNRLVNANFELDMLYDKNQSESAQTRQSLSIGIAFLAL